MARRRTARIVKIAIAVVVMAAAGAAALYWLATRDSGEQGELIEERVRRGDLELLVSCTGTLSAVETVDIGAQVSGTISKVHADFNDRVEQGQVLLELDTSLLEAEVREAKASVAKARAEMEKSKADRARVKKLLEKGYATEEEDLVAETAVVTARASLKAAQAMSTRASAQLGYAVIRSPIDGTVLARNVEEGQTIASSFNTPSLFILAADLAQMQIEASVDESDIGLIREGQVARFTVQAYPDRVWEGSVRQVRLTPETIQNVVNYTVVVDVRNDDGTLLPGMTATVDFVVDGRKDVLLVPNKALGFELTPDMLPSPGGLRLPWLSGPPEAPGPPPGPVPEGKERIWVRARHGPPVALDLVAGLTDGSRTEVVACDGLEEGATIITGYLKTGQKAEKSRRRLLGPPRGPGGPPI